MDELTKHVEHMYTNDYNSESKAKCECCQSAVGESNHHRAYLSKPKLTRRLPKRVLIRLYGNKANLIRDSSVNTATKKTNPSTNTANKLALAALPVRATS